jgi:hypothetical protein
MMTAGGMFLNRTAGPCKRRVLEKEARIRDCQPVRVESGIAAKGTEGLGLRAGLLRVLIVMSAQPILLIVGTVFLLFAAMRAVRDRRLGPAPRTWLIVGGIFIAVSLYLLAGCTQR